MDSADRWTHCTFNIVGVIYRALSHRCLFAFSLAQSRDALEAVDDEVHDLVLVRLLAQISSG